MAKELTMSLRYKINMKSMFTEHNANVFNPDNTEIIKQAKKNVGGNGRKSSVFRRKVGEKK